MDRVLSQNDKETKKIPKYLLIVPVKVLVSVSVVLLINSLTGLSSPVKYKVILLKLSKGNAEIP